MALCGKIKIRFIFFKDGSISIEIHFLCTILMYVFDVFYFFSSFLQSSLARNVDCPYVVALSNQHWPVHYIPRLIKQVHVWGLKCILTAVKMSYCKEFVQRSSHFLDRGRCCSAIFHWTSWVRTRRSLSGSHFRVRRSQLVLPLLGTLLVD